MQLEIIHYCNKYQVHLHFEVEHNTDQSLICASGGGSIQAPWVFLDLPLMAMEFVLIIMKTYKK